MLTSLVPADATSLDLEQEADRDLVAELYRPPRPDWVRLNLIGSISGSAAGTDGTSETLTNPTDRLILRSIRNLADVVVVGAASVRAEGYFVPRFAALAVVTGSGDLSGHRITTETSSGSRGPLLVVTCAGSVDTVRRTLGDTPATILVVTDVAQRLAASDILAALRAAGYRSVVCEGGPTLAAQFVDSGLVDEICLTTTPMVNGGALPLFGGSSFTERRLSLTQLLADEQDCLYARWAVTEP
ncbi:MAG TPA: dihydrofolate reductase family protein [Glaciihabitans sp.]|jgi:riboflavin biosynthesis pyrimidine reductase|nr:dihydrofolate reductase family protein [Glaciihabitans sp.]